MTCPPSAFAYNAPCAPSKGGIKAILVANPDAVLVNSYIPANGTCTLAPASIGAKPFYRWEVAPGQSTLTTEAQINEANNVRYFATDLVAVLNGFDAEAAGSNLLLNRLTRLAFIVECENGNAYFLGIVSQSGHDDSLDAVNKPRGAEVTAFNWTPGQAAGDALRASITAHLDSLTMPPKVAGYSALVNG